MMHITNIRRQFFKIGSFRGAAAARAGIPGIKYDASTLQVVDSQGVRSLCRVPLLRCPIISIMLNKIRASLYVIDTQVLRRPHWGTWRVQIPRPVRVALPLPVNFSELKTGVSTPEKFGEVFFGC